MEQKIPLGALAELLGGRLTDPAKAGEIISGVSSLDAAGPGQLAFLWKEDYAEAAKRSEAAAIVCREPLPGARAPQVLVDDPQAAMLTLLGQVHALRHPPQAPGVHPDASVAEGVHLGEDCSVGAGAVVERGARIGARSQIKGLAYVGRGVVVGEDCTIHPGAVLLDHVRLGDRVVIWSGAVVGRDGFGFVQDAENRHTRIPQVGGVVIEDDVEVGPLTTVDRGALEDTVLRRGVKIDAHCHVAHNCEIGENALLVGYARMGGSVRIGKNAYLLQDAGVSSGRSVGEGAILGTCCHALHKDVPAGATMGGCPARPAMQHRRIEVSLARLPEMRKQLHRLEKELAALRARD